jgi:DNA segregation ATPase FtsK/SpoIIIE, S-DNA-T family
MKVNTRPASRRRREAEESISHLHADVVGILLVALAIITALSLALSNTGVLGQALSSVFHALFGNGAWGMPLLIGGIALAVFSGRRSLNITAFTWGALIVYLAVLGMLAAPGQDQDFFSPSQVNHSGGFFGAFIGWTFFSLLGDARFVGLGTMSMIGMILCGNTSLKTILESIRERAEDRVVIKKPEKVKPVPHYRQAVVTTPDGEEEPKVDEARQKRLAPLFKDTAAKPPPAITLATNSSKEGYQLPPLNLLAEVAAKPKRSQQEMQRNIETLEGTLEEFGIDANVVEVATGPTVTRYEIQLGPGIRVARITALADNIAMNLAASHVRVEAPIPGKAAIGVEVPNSSPTQVTLREVCDTREFMENPSRLAVCLGQDVSGMNKYTDLTRMPHLLICGATNSGKSIGLATIITSLLIRNTPKDLRFVMIDPKRVELALFDNIPHLMCPVVRDVKEAPGVLRAVWREMDRRYDTFANEGVRNIDGWNAKASFQDKMPYIVVVIDELADLMIQAAAEVETSICRLAQLARATGIHLVIATQRPSVDVITGTIKANIASRIAFTVSSQIDSRTILDQKGAEALIGRGDMLFLPIDASKPVRIQGCYVSEKEIESVCTFWRDQEGPSYVLTPVAEDVADPKKENGDFGGEVDTLWEDAVRWVADRGQASTSMLQRKFSIGFQRASRLLDMMEERQIVGPRDGPRPREVLVSPMDADALFGGEPYGDTGWIGDD